MYILPREDIIPKYIEIREDTIRRKNFVKSLLRSMPPKDFVELAEFIERTGTDGEKASLRYAVYNDWRFDINTFIIEISNNEVFKYFIRFFVYNGMGFRFNSPAILNIKHLKKWMLNTSRRNLRRHLNTLSIFKNYISSEDMEYSVMMACKMPQSKFYKQLLTGAYPFSKEQMDRLLSRRTLENML